MTTAPSLAAEGVVFGCGEGHRLSADDPRGTTYAADQQLLVELQAQRLGQEAHHLLRRAAGREHRNEPEGLGAEPLLSQAQAGCTMRT